jgi:hypothetical protein
MDGKRVKNQTKERGKERKKEERSTCNNSSSLRINLSFERLMNSIDGFDGSTSCKPMLPIRNREYFFRSPSSSREPPGTPNPRVPGPSE